MKFPDIESDLSAIRAVQIASDPQMMVFDIILQLRTEGGGIESGNVCVPNIWTSTSTMALPLARDLVSVEGHFASAWTK